MTALAALQIMLFNRLRGTDEWGDRVFADMATAGTVRPYCIFFWAGGGDELIRQGVQNARLVMTVKCVADTQGAAFGGAARIEALLRSQGSQEEAGIPATSGWVVTTVTQDRVVHLVEAWEGAERIYHDGHQYIFRMETI